MGTDAFVSCGKACEHAVAFDGMFASRSPGRAETCEQTLRARRLKTPGARRSVCKSSLFRLSKNQPLRQTFYGLKEKLVPIIPPVWRAAILAAVTTSCAPPATISVARTKKSIHTLFVSANGVELRPCCIVRVWSCMRLPRIL